MLLLSSEPEPEPEPELDPSSEPNFGNGISSPGGVTSGGGLEPLPLSSSLLPLSPSSSVVE